jgi:hypothetical protein
MLLLGCNQPSEYTPRHVVGSYLAHTTSLRIEITKSLAISPGKPVPQAGALKLSQIPGGFRTPEFDFGWVTTGGAIVIQNTKFAVVVLQEPTLDQGKVTWSCIVHPAEAKPNLCGSDYQNSLLQNK